MNNIFVHKGRRSRMFHKVILTALLFAPIVFSGCLESPIAFSPDGQEIAFTVCEPLMNGKFLEPGAHHYRLMRLTGQKTLQPIDESSTHILTAPSYSPDGKQIAYLRIKLPETPKAVAKPMREELTAKSVFDTVKEFDYAFTWNSLFYQMLDANPKTKPFEAEMVIFDLDAPANRKEIPVTIPVYKRDGIVTLYMTCQPKFSPDAKDICFGTSEVLLSLNLKTKKVRKIAIPAENAVLSPDGQTFAIPADNYIAFVSIDGKKSSIAKLSARPAALTVNWVNRSEIVLLTKTPISQKRTRYELVRMRSDGRILSKTKLKLPQDIMDDSIYLAISPKAKEMVLASQKGVLFMDNSGEIVFDYKPEKNTMLLNPTFSPDGKRIAMKHLRQEKYSADADEKSKTLRTDGIAFFSPKGKELLWVEFTPSPKFPPVGYTPPATVPTKREIPAKPKTAAFVPPADKTILVFPEAPLEDKNMEKILASLSTKLNKQLLAHKVTDDVVEYNKLSALKRTPDFNKLSVSEIGKKAGAGIVLYVRINRFALKDSSVDPDAWRGRLQCHIRMVDVDKGRLWPKAKTGKAISVETKPVKKQPKSYGSKLAEKLTTNLADEICQHFYNDAPTKAPINRPDITAKTDERE